MTHDYKRHGTTTLFAALDVLEGKVIGRCMQRHHGSGTVAVFHGSGSALGPRRSTRCPLLSGWREIIGGAVRRFRESRRPEAAEFGGEPKRPDAAEDARGRR